MPKMSIVGTQTYYNILPVEKSALYKHVIDSDHTIDWDNGRLWVMKTTITKMFF